MLPDANLELQTTLYTYAGLAGVCLFFFILFSIIVKASKRRREREYEEEAEYDEEEAEEKAVYDTVKLSFIGESWDTSFCNE